MNLNGVFKINQSNFAHNPMTWTMDQPDASHVEGTAIADMSGSIKGFINGNHVTVTVHWANGQIGVYSWDVDANGMMTNGSCFDAQATGSTATLNSGEIFA